MSHCTGCGQPASAGDHQTCHRRQAFEPPRFCPRCGRRMVVQIIPMSWTATCSQHGEMHSAAAQAAP